MPSASLVRAGAVRPVDVDWYYTSCVMLTSIPCLMRDQRYEKISALTYCQYRNHQDGLPGERFRLLFFRIQDQEVCVIPEPWYCV